MPLHKGVLRQFVARWANTSHPQKILRITQDKYANKRLRNPIALTRVNAVY